MPSALVRKVADYCWSNSFLDVFHKYFADHADAFIDAPEMLSGEHNMEYYDLFQKYLLVYEESLTKFVTSIDCSIEEFYAEVREAQDESVDPYLRVFIDCLLASADYESFYKVMVREGKKRSLAIKKAEKVALAEAKLAAEGGAAPTQSKELPDVAAEAKAGVGPAADGKQSTRSPERELVADMKALDVGPAESKGESKEADAKIGEGEKLGSDSK